MPSAHRLLAPSLLLVTLALGAAGCSGESGPVDDGTLSSLRAGAPDILADLDIDLVALDDPVAAGPDDVVAVLEEKGLDAQAYDLGRADALDGIALEPERIAGLLGLVGSAESSTGPDRFVVLAFDSLEAAVVLAASEPQVFDDAGLEDARATYFSGNLVAYYAPEGEGDATDRFRAALEALAGA